MENDIETNVSIRFLADGDCRKFIFPFELFAIENINVYIGKILQETGYNIIIDKISGGGSVVFENPPKFG